MSTTAEALRPIFRLAWPVLAEEILNLLVGYTEWWLAGHFLEGPDYKAAMGLMAYALWVIPSLFSAAAIGATALTARFVGAERPDVARRVLHQALLVGAVIALVITVSLGFFAAEFVSWMRFSGPAAQLAVEYLSILVWVVPAIMFEQVTIASLRGAGDTVSGLIAKTAVNVVNTLVSVGCVVGWGLFPQLGWTGLAWGATCGHAVGALFLLILLLRGRARLQFRWSEFRPDASLIRRLLWVGLPAGFDVLALIGCHLIYFAIISGLSTLAAGGHGLGVQIESLAYAAGAAFQVAAATLTGQCLGAGSPQRALQAVRATSVVAVTYYVAVGLLFFFGGHHLASFFTGPADRATADLAADYLRIVSYSMPSLAIIIVLTGALRGAGDTRWPLVVTIGCMVFVRLGGACFLAWQVVPLPGTNIVWTGLDWGVHGAWYAMVADVIARSGLLTWRFARGAWKNLTV